jgi:diguanylate cyclase (GGDEF)-like protein
MELLLWRWSTAMQMTSAAMIAVFFAVLARTNRRAELKWWVRAWIANLVALSVTIAYWFASPPPAVVPFVGAVYLALKTTFLLLLLQGAGALLRPGSILFSTRLIASAAGVMALLGVFVLTDISRIGVGQHVVMTAILGGGALWLSLQGEHRVVWLAVGLAIRAALAGVEAIAYASQLAPVLSPGMAASAGEFLSVHSSFDTGAEWLLTLGCVLGIAERTHTELRAQNERLLAAQDDLRRLADRDPLTGLDNRRALPAVLRSVQPHGAILLFFDIDQFKRINDLYGHRAGDECLTQFATALRECFRPSDAVLRYAGDEFLVIASGLDRSAVDERVARLQSRMRTADARLAPFTFSVGIAELSPGGDPEHALEAADRHMYRTKSSRRIPAV